MSTASHVVELQEPMAHQVPALLHPARFKVMISGRRWGKTHGFGRVAAVVGHGPGCTARRGALYGAQVWWVVPAYDLATEVWDAFEVELQNVTLKKNANLHRFAFPGGGSVTIKSSDNPDGLRGRGLNLIIVDELKDHAVKVWKDNLRPALSDKHGSAIFLGTAGYPIEEDLSYNLFTRAQGRKGWARWQRPTSDNPIVTPLELEDMREELGPIGFARECEAQFVVAGGALFKRESFRWYDVQAPGLYRVGNDPVRLEDLHRFTTVDLAATTKTYSDYTAISTWGVLPDGRILLLNVVRKKIDGAAILRALHSVTEAWNPSGVWIEKTAYHTLLIDEARAQGIPVRELISDKDKVTRAQPAAEAIESGRVWFPRAGSLFPWLDEWVAELLVFPDPSAKDDQVDTLSSAIARAKPLRGGGTATAGRRSGRRPSGFPGLDIARPS